MSLEEKSKELKDFVSKYRTDWFLGNLSFLTTCIADGKAQDQLGKLSSPLRQLYFVAGLTVSTDPAKGQNIQYTNEEWATIVTLLNEIEFEYDKLFFPKPDEEIDEQWKKVREVAMPSFLGYFNLGPLNYEEQTINWVRDLFTQLDKVIEGVTGFKTEDFIQFYESVDVYVQNNFKAFSNKHAALRADWKKYARLEVGVVEGTPEVIATLMKEREALHIFMADSGIINRFLPEDIANEKLSVDQVNAILKYLSCSRAESDFLYYTSTKPGNPLYDKPIVDIGNGMYQVFEVKQVIHAIENFLEDICLAHAQDKYVKKKGTLLEKNVLDLFIKFLGKNARHFKGYYVDGHEQDLLFLWKDYAFIIEAKGYNVREPSRDPDRAFERINQDFDRSIRYGYTQAQRVAKKFEDQVPLRITDKHGKLIEEIDTTKYEENDFTIIVNLNSFGQIQVDLSALIPECTYPWAVKLDDLEVFFLTMIQKKKPPMFFVNFLLLRENLHGKVICADELDICGAYLTGKLTQKKAEEEDTLFFPPVFAAVFDEQNKQGMGFKNEKYLAEKRSKKYLFW